MGYPKNRQHSQRSVPLSGSLKQRAYSYIYERLVNGEFSPGTPLSNRALAKEIGISYIPVRDAIGQLRGEGFITSSADGSHFVPEPSYEELMEIYDFREALECHAAVKVCRFINDALMKELRRYCDVFASVIKELEQSGGKMNNPSLLLQWSKTDAAFHDSIMSAAGNRQTLDTIRRLRVKSRIFGTKLKRHRLESLRRVCEEHYRILNAFEQGDAEAVREAMSEHIRNGCSISLEAYHRSRLNAASVYETT